MKRISYLLFGLLFANSVSMQAQLNGVFSVSSSQKVQFSKGLLRYNPAAQTWGFAGTQYAVIGSSNGNVSASYNGYIDLFGWGTSGYNDCYPYLTTTENTSYGPSGNISGTQYDWGVRHMPGYRTLTSTEWSYLLTSRTNAQSKRGLGQVAGVNGLILLPDEFTLPSGCSFTSGNSSYSQNTYSASTWTQMENAGAVFLPAAGYRYSSNGISYATYINSLGYYWTSTASGTLYANSLQFGAGFCYVSGSEVQRFNGFAVRLVKNSSGTAVSDKGYITVNTVPYGAGSTTGGGEYPNGTNVTISVVPYDGYTFDHWQDGSTSTTRTITVNGNATYSAIMGRESGTYQVSAYVRYGKGKVTGTGWYPKDTTISLYAHPAEGYVFDKWDDGLTNQFRSYKVTSDVRYEVDFRKAGDVTLRLSCDSTMGEMAIGKAKKGQTVLDHWVARGSDISYTCKEQDTLLVKFFKTNDRYYVKQWQSNEDGVNAPSLHGSMEEYKYIIMNRNYDLSPVMKEKTIQYTISALDDPSGKVTFSGTGTYYEYDTAYLYVNRDCIVKNLQGQYTEKGRTYNWTKKDNTPENRDYYSDLNLLWKGLVTADRDYTITSFSEFGGQFDVTINDTTMGTVIGTGSDCDGEEMQAIPNPGYVFLGWTSPYFETGISIVPENPVVKDLYVFWTSYNESSEYYNAYLYKYLRTQYRKPSSSLITIPITANFAPLSVVVSGYCGIPDEAAQYIFTNDGTLTIVGSGPLKEFVNIDSLIYRINRDNSYKETAEAAIEYAQSCVPWLGLSVPVRKVVISEGITSIGGGYLAGCILEKTLFPSSIDHLSDAAFFGAKNVDLNPFIRNLKVIPRYAFSHARLYIPYTQYMSSVPKSKYPTIYLAADSIYTYAFNKTSFFNVVLPNNLEYIEANAFRNTQGINVVCLNTKPFSLHTGTQASAVFGHYNGSSQTTHLHMYNDNATATNPYGTTIYTVIDTTYKIQKPYAVHNPSGSKSKLFVESNPIFRYNNDTTLLLANQRINFSIEPGIGYKLTHLRVYNGTGDFKIGAADQTEATMTGLLPEKYQLTTKQDFWIANAGGRYANSSYRLTIAATYEALPLHNITASANDDTQGYVTGGGEYPANYDVKLTAIPYDGYAFYKWEDGNVDNPRTIFVIDDEHHTAYFYQIPVNSENIEEIVANDDMYKAKGVTKILHNGQIYIIRGEKIYTITGQEVK